MVLALPFGKKAVFFTLATIFFVAALALLFSTNQPVESYNTKTATVYVMDSYRNKLETIYIPLLVRHYSYNALEAMSEEAYNKPAYGYLSFPQDFNETLMNGSLRGNAIVGFDSLNTAFGNLSNISRSLGYNLSIVVYEVKINQIGAYEAAYTANVTFNLTSRDGLVLFQRNVTTIGTFSLVGIQDLYYNKQAPGSTGVPRRFKPYLPTSYNAAAFATFVNGNYYRVNNESPSILDRLQGQNTKSPWGVESAIPGSFTPAGDLTSMDFEYFQSMHFSCTYIPSAPNGMRVSLNTVFDYNLSGTSQGFNGGSCAPGP